MEPNSHLACVVHITIVDVAKQFLHITLVDELCGGFVSMLSAHPKKAVAFWIPTDPLLCCELIKHHHGMKYLSPTQAVKQIQNTSKRCINIGLHLILRGLSMGRNDRWND